MLCGDAASQAAGSRLVSTFPIKDVLARVPTPQAGGPRYTLPQFFTEPLIQNAGGAHPHLLRPRCRVILSSAMEPIRTLFERPQPAGPPALPGDLRLAYGGDLRFPVATGRPYVIGNFVSTLDGVVSFSIPGKSGGGDVSGFNEGDRFIMGLLRASADAVMVGSATLAEAGKRHLLAAESVNPPAAESYRRYRGSALQKQPYPISVIVSGNGSVDLERATFHTPGLRAVIITTEPGRERLCDKGVAALASTEVRVIPAPGSILPASAILDLLWREYGVRLLLHEGGPALFGSFVSLGLVDEFFLTIAPQLAGRNPGSKRPGMIAGVEFPPADAPWLELLSVKQNGDHLYLRHRPRQASLTADSSRM